MSLDKELITAFREEMRDGFQVFATEMRAGLGEVKDELRTGLAGVNARLDQTNVRLDQTNIRLDRTIERLDHLEKELGGKLSGISSFLISSERTYAQLEKRVSKLEDRADASEKKDRDG